MSYDERILRFKKYELQLQSYVVIQRIVYTYKIGIT